MNQTFKQKAVVVALSAVFAAAAVPAVANQFSDATTVVGISAGVNVAKGTSQPVSAQQVTLTEVGTGIVSTGNVVLSLDNSAKFSEVAVTPTTATLNLLAIEPSAGSPTAIANTATNVSDILAVLKAPVSSSNKWVVAALTDGNANTALNASDFVRVGIDTSLATAKLKAGAVLDITMAHGGTIATGTAAQLILDVTLMDGKRLVGTITHPAANTASTTPAANDVIAYGIGADQATALANAAAATSTVSATGISQVAASGSGADIASAAAFAASQLVTLNSLLNTAYGANLAAATAAGANTHLWLGGVAKNNTAGVTTTLFTSPTIARTGQATAVIADGVALGGTANSDVATSLSTAINAQISGATSTSGSTLTLAAGKSAAASATTGVTGFSTNKLLVDSNGKLIVPVATVGASGGNALLLTNQVLDTSSSTISTPVNLSLDSLSTATGWNTVQNSAPVSSVKIAVVSTTGVSVTAPTASKVVAGQTAAGGIPTFSFKENLVGSVGTAVGNVKLTLKNGYTWGTKPTLQANVGAVTTNNGTATGSSTTVASYTWGGTNTTPATLTFTAVDMFVPSGSTSDIVATLTVLDTTGATVLSQDITLAQITAKGVTTAFVESTGGAVAYDTLFTGRNYTTGVTDSVKLTETAGDALTAGSSLAFKLSNNVTFTTDGTTAISSDAAAATVTTSTAGFTLGSNGSTANDNIFTVSSTDKTSAIYTVADSASTAGVINWKLNKFSTVGATAGDLTVTASSNSGGSATALKYATIVDATTSSVSGSFSTVAAGGSVTVPDIVIQENAVGAYANNNVVAIDFGANATIVDATGTVKAEGGTLVNGKDVTVKVFNAAGADVTATALGTTPTITLGDAAATTNGAARQLFIQITSASTTGTGTYKITVSGLQVKTSTTATAGNLVATLGGASSAGTSTQAAMAAEGGTAWTSLAAATKNASLTYANVVGAVNPSYPVATVADQTKLTLTNLPLVAAGNDQGRQGAVYVALIYGTNVFFQAADGSWNLYTGPSNVPAYFTGTLGTTTLNIVPTAIDASSAKGALFVAGYGLGIAGLGNPFDDFIKNARYNVVYQVK